MDELEGILINGPTMNEWLAGVTFPIGRDALVAHLEGQDAPPQVVEALRTAGITRFARIEDVVEVVDGFAL